MSFSKYGLVWSDGTHPIEIERQMIRRGGQWQGQHAIYGHGLFFHYLAMRALIWPNRYRHKWTDLIYEQILKNQMTFFMGAASTQKTSHISEWALLKYWCFPENCCVLVSTVNMEKLESSIFGEIKMLWQAGREVYPELAGNLIDYKKLIATDDIEEVEARDTRKGIIGKPCFPTGTMVDTIRGSIPIESIRIGDLVRNALGFYPVKNRSLTIASQLVRLQFSNGKTIDCTPEHPFFTLRGWIKAVDVRRSDIILSPDEALRILQEGDTGRACQPAFLFNKMPGQQIEKEVCVLPESLLCRPATNCFLFAALCREINFVETTGYSANVGQTQHKTYGGAFEPDYSFQSKGAAAAPVNGFGPQSRIARWTDQSRSDTIENFSRSRFQFQNFKTGQSETWFASSISHRFSLAGNQIGSRAGWAVSSSSEGHYPRCETHRLPYGTRVDRIEVLESAGDYRYSKSLGGYPVYNLEVAAHPSYSVENFLVHNCYVGQRYVGLGVFAGIKQEHFVFICDELQFMAPTFLDCLPNMLSNTGAGGLKVIGSGNPKHDPEDQLGIACEPIDGWSTVENITETTIWQTKFGTCVNLIGTDSPNFHSPPDQPEPYPRLIGRKYAADIARIWGKESAEYEKQVMGRMKLALASCRVITRQLCREHNAQDEIIWTGSEPLTRIYAIDPAYGGGDRCVAGYVEFGRAINGRIMLKVGTPKVIPINPQAPLTPEMQIATAVKRDLDAENIPARNCFYDSFGKGTIGFAFAQVFGADCPIPVDSGARPSRRIVREGLFIEDSNGTKRLKRCDEHYSKFVTEAWFSVRYTIEANQLGNLPEDVMHEGCMRVYVIVNGDKIEVEPKADMRERLGKSPDKFDWLAVAVEGARQRGFVINRLGANVQIKKGPDWLDKRFTDYQKLSESARLSVLD